MIRREVVGRHVLARREGKNTEFGEELVREGSAHNATMTSGVSPSGRISVDAPPER